MSEKMKFDGKTHPRVSSAQKEDGMDTNPASPDFPADASTYHNKKEDSATVSSRWGRIRNYPKLTRAEWIELTGIDTASPFLNQPMHKLRRPVCSEEPDNEDESITRAPSFTLPPDQYFQAARNLKIETEDEVLVDQFLAGDYSKFNELVAKHYRRIWFLCRRYTDNYDDAYDVLQDCLLKAYRNIHLYNRESSFGTWLHRLVTNQAYDSFAKRKNAASNLPLDEQTVNPEVERAISHDPIDGLDISITLRESLAKLHADQREAIVLVDFLGYDIPIAAAKVGVRPGTIKSRRARARLGLRQILRPNDQQD